MYDYEASIQRLAEQLAKMRTSNWSPTPEVEALRGMASRLTALADELDGARWMCLEATVDSLPPKEVGIDGCPVNSPEDRTGLFKGTLWRMREIAELAQREADAYPDPRTRLELPFAAMAFLHIQHHCEKQPFPPSLYDDGNGVSEFDRVCQLAGIVKSKSTLRNALSKALKDFDLYFDQTASLDSFIFFKQ